MTTIRRLTSCHVATREAPDRHQIKGAYWMIAITQYASDSRDCSQSRSVDLHQTDAMGALCGSRSNMHPTATMKRDPPLFVMISGASDFNRTVQTDRVRTPRSWSNRPAITARSTRDHGAIDPRSESCRGGIATSRSDGDRRTVKTTIVARSWRDRGPIVAKMRLI